MQGSFAGEKPVISRNCSKRYRLSRGPGEASEWYWMERMGSSRCRRPSTVPSFRFMWLTSSPSSQGVGVDRIAVVLCGDMDLPGLQILHRVVAAPVPELELEGLRPESAADELVAQADAHDRLLAHEALHRCHHVVQQERVPRARREQDAVRTSVPESAPAEQVQGTTVTLQPRLARMRSMLYFRPQSITTM